MSIPSFRIFIQSMLERAHINQKYRESFTDANGMQLFQKVITHPTHDPENNYQELEFIGDGIIKGILSQYILRRFPNLASGESKYSKKGTGEGVLSKIRRFLEQRKILSEFGLKLGFWDYVQADDNTLTKLRKGTLEDVFEAFIGALVEIVDQRIKRGLGYYYAYNFMEASLNEISIEIKKETLDDPITRLNELYKANELKGSKKPLKWGDAIYTTIKMYLPRVEELPSITDQEEGTVVFSEVNKVAYIATPKGWVPASRVPLIQLHHTPIPDPDGLQLNQLMWHAGVYGFPDAPGDVVVTKDTRAAIQKDPDTYNADIIGQGLHFLAKEAKKMAATQALQFLHHKGFRKA